MFDVRQLYNEHIDLSYVQFCKVLAKLKENHFYGMNWMESLYTFKNTQYITQNVLKKRIGL